jgi:hypothetical protein
MHDHLAQFRHLSSRSTAPNRQSVCTVIGYHEQWYPNLLVCHLYCVYTKAGINQVDPGWLYARRTGSEGNSRDDHHLVVRLKFPDGDDEQTRWTYEAANERERSAVLVKTWQAPLERVILRIKATSDSEREHFLGRVLGYLAQDRLKEGSQVGTVSMGRIRGPTMKVLLFLSFIC